MCKDTLKLYPGEIKDLRRWKTRKSMSQHRFTCRPSSGGCIYSRGKKSKIKIIQVQQFQVDFWVDLCLGQAIVLEIFFFSNRNKHIRDLVECGVLAVERYKCSIRQSWRAFIWTLDCLLGLLCCLDQCSYTDSKYKCFHLKVGLVQMIITKSPRLHICIPQSAFLELRLSSGSIHNVIGLVAVSWTETK